MRFRRDRRVRKRPEFQRAQREGRRITTPHFVLVLARNENAAPGARLGITASRKFGNAVRRNRIKRVVREAFRQTEGFLPAGVDLIVICLRDDPELTTAQVVTEWSAVRERLERLGRSLSRPRQESPLSPKAPS